MDFPPRVIESRKQGNQINLEGRLRMIVFIFINMSFAGEVVYLLNLKEVENVRL